MYGREGDVSLSTFIEFHKWRNAYSPASGQFCTVMNKNAGAGVSPGAGIRGPSPVLGRSVTETEMPEAAMPMPAASSPMPSYEH